VAGLLDGIDNSLDIEGFDGAEVDDFGFDAVFGLELLSSDEALADATGESDDSNVLAGAFNFGFAELYGLLISIYEHS